MYLSALDPSQYTIHEMIERSSPLNIRNSEAVEAASAPQRDCDEDLKAKRFIVGGELLGDDFNG